MKGDKTLFYAVFLYDDKPGIICYNETEAKNITEIGGGKYRPVEADETDIKVLSNSHVSKDVIKSVLSTFFFDVKTDCFGAFEMENDKEKTDEVINQIYEKLNR